MVHTIGALMPTKKGASVLISDQKLKTASPKNNIVIHLDPPAMVFIHTFILLICNTTNATSNVQIIFVIRWM